MANGMKRWIGGILAVLAVLGIAVWFVTRTPSHPEFGVIYHAEMKEAFVQPEWRRAAEDSIRRWLQLEPKYRYGEHGLPVGSVLLGWSLRNNTPPRTGFVYLQEVRPKQGNAPLWEVARCDKRRLKDVTTADLTNEFVGVRDPRGTNLFAAAYVEGKALLINEGDILLARLITNRSTIYVVHFAKQGGTDSGGSMQARYLIVTNSVR